MAFGNLYGPNPSMAAGATATFTTTADSIKAYGLTTLETP